MDLFCLVPSSTLPSIQIFLHWTVFLVLVLWSCCLFFIFGCMTCTNPCSLQWKLRVLTTGQPVKSLDNFSAFTGERKQNLPPQHMPLWHIDFGGLIIIIFPNFINFLCFGVKDTSISRGKGEYEPYFF